MTSAEARSWRSIERDLTTANRAVGSAKIAEDASEGKVKSLNRAISSLVLAKEELHKIRDKELAAIEEAAENDEAATAAR